MGVRTRIRLAVVAVVALTALVLGVVTNVVVDGQLRDQLLGDARRQVTFNLAELVPRSGLAPDADAAAFEQTDLPAQFRLRGGDTGVVVEFADGDRYVEPLAFAGLTVPAELDAAIARGELGYAWTRLGERPLLVVGGVPRSGGPRFFFGFDATAVETATATLRVAFLVGAALVLVAALLIAGWVAGGLLRPVRDAGAAASAIAAGDLAARIPVTSGDELGDLAVRFNTMVDTLEATIEELEQAQAQNRRFVADVAHELRTPLTALVAEAELLRAQVPHLPRDARRPAELLVEDVGRLRTLTEDLMELSRFDAAAERPASAREDLVALVRAIAASRAPGATLDLPAGAVVVDTDRRRLDRILGNLLDNAREHAPGSPVEVGLVADDVTALVWVADRGPGVPDEQLEAIFERFHKADPSRRSGSSGLGLAIAAEHAALLGGSLRARPRDGGGLRFELRLPVTRSLPDGDGAVNRPAEAGPR